MRSTICLPEDMIVEIFSRVPTISLTRFRSVSKRWNALFNDARFAKKHFTNAPRQSLVIMLINYRVCLVSLDLRYNNDLVAATVKVTSQFSLKDPLRNASKEVAIREIFHCDGLLLCISTEDRRLVVWNQCTGETRWIDNNRPDYIIYALGKTSCNKYKILRVRECIQNSRMTYEYEVYEFCSNSWKVVGVTQDFRIFGCRRHSVSLKGNSYWVGTSRRKRTKDKLLVTFDFSTETIRSHSLPIQFNNSLSCVASLSLSVVREEKLCLLNCLCGAPLDVWIAETTDTGIMTWTKFLTHKVTPYKFYHHGISFVAEEQNKGVLCTAVSNNTLHIVAEDRCMEVDHHGAGNYYQLILGYVPTLVQIQQGI